MTERPKALLVDDDFSLRFLAKKQISSLGIDCELACDGQEAVQKAAERFDLIFMDLSMPIMDGLEATKRIRENERRLKINRTPIVGLTAFDEEDRCMSAGMDNFIQKPLLLDNLKAMVKKYLIDKLDCNF